MFTRHLIRAVGLAAAMAVAAGAQGVASGPGTHSNWSVGSDDFADLWFHCLAVLGYDGYGPFAMYDRAYAARGASPPAGLRQRLERDSALEVVHFVPLYFRGQAPSAALAALRASARQQPLRELVDFARGEWQSVVRDERARGAAVRSSAEARRQDLWRRDFVPALAPYLEAASIRGGWILISPAVGREGRFVRATDGSVVIVVGGVAADTSGAPLLAAVRELAFPIVRRALGDTAPAPDRARAEWLSDIAATRAGAMLLDVVSPALARQYRAMYGASTSASFDTRFPLDPAVESRLRHATLAMAHAVSFPGR